MNPTAPNPQPTSPAPAVSPTPKSSKKWLLIGSVIGLIVIIGIVAAIIIGQSRKITAADIQKAQTAVQAMESSIKSQGSNGSVTDLEASFNKQLQIIADSGVTRNAAVNKAYTRFKAKDFAKLNDAQNIGEGVGEVSDVAAQFAKDKVWTQPNPSSNATAIAYFTFEKTAEDKAAKTLTNYKNPSPVIQDYVKSNITNFTSASKIFATDIASVQQGKDLFLSSLTDQANTDLTGLGLDPIDPSTTESSLGPDDLYATIIAESNIYTGDLNTQLESSDFGSKLEAQVAKDVITSDFNALKTAINNLSAK